MAKNMIKTWTALFLLLGVQQYCEAYPVDLNDFTAVGNVTIASDGNSASLQEDADFGSAFLSNDPWWSEPGIFIPLDVVSMTFDYMFEEPFGNFDELYAWLFDWQTYSILSDAFGNPLEFSITEPGSGSVFWNLSNASFLGETVGMQIELNYDPANDPWPSRTLSENSTARVANLRVNPVPEPSTVFTLTMGLLGLISIRVWTKKKTK